MSAHTADSQFSFKLPSLSYIDAKWEEPNLYAPASNGVSRKHGLGAWLSRRIAGMVNAYRYRADMAELSAMSDRELMDIGINRSDLARVFHPEYNQDLQQRGKAG